MAEWRLGPRIQELLGDRSQADLARDVHLSRERVGQIIRGRVQWPEVDTFNAMARALEVPVSDLLRAAGADIPNGTVEEVSWLLSQLDDDGQALLVELGRALLPRHRRRSETDRP